jgi:rRNA small subunit aminocarboxypropyltransferase
VKLEVVLLKQDDPIKCTALKLVKFGLAKRVQIISKHSLILNPFSKILVSAGDRFSSRSICAVDCSWENIRNIIENQTIFTFLNNRRLPSLLAGNPTNYSKLGKLTTAEALAGCAYILGNRRLAIALMNKFKWGHTFLELNAEPLEEYSCAMDQEKIMQIERDYFQ